MAQSAAQRRASLKNLRKARSARRKKNPANPTRKKRRHSKSASAAPRRRHARRHNPANPTRTRRRSHRRKTHVRGYRRRNPAGMNGTTIVLTAIGGFLGFESTDFVDRMIATRTPEGGKHAMFYTDAMAAAYGSPDGMRYAAAFGQAIGSGLLAYWAHKRHMERTSYLFSGWAFGSGLWIANILYRYKLVGKLFPATKNEEKIGNRAYPDWQDSVVAGLDATRDAALALGPAQTEPLSYAGRPGLASGSAPMAPQAPRLAGAPAALGCGGTSGCGPSCACDSCRQKRDRDAEAQYVREINLSASSLAGNRPRRHAA